MEGSDQQDSDEAHVLIHTALDLGILSIDQAAQLLEAVRRGEVDDPVEWMLVNAHITEAAALHLQELTAQALQPLPEALKPGTPKLAPFNAHLHARHETNKELGKVPPRQGVAPESSHPTPAVLCLSAPPLAMPDAPEAKAQPSAADPAPHLDWDELFTAAAAAPDHDDESPPRETSPYLEANPWDAIAGESERAPAEPAVAVAVTAAQSASQPPVFGAKSNRETTAPEPGRQKITPPRPREPLRREETPAGIVFLSSETPADGAIAPRPVPVPILEAGRDPSPA